MTDPYLWLEDVTAEQSLNWAREHNARTLDEYTEDAEFSALESRIRDILDTDDRIPYVVIRGEYLYNFWRDGRHKRGIWRRTLLEQYRTESPEWDVLLDVDELAEREGENWVWAGATVLRPARSRALLSFSRGGADASVVREFDLESREFVAGDYAFNLPEAKTTISWIDEDTVYVGTDFGEGSMTNSGYPRIAKRWRRGTPLAEAITVFEGEPTDVSVSASYDDTPGYTRHFISRSLDFYNSERYQLLSDGSLQRIETPTDAAASVYRNWLTIRPRTDWEVDGTIHPAGSLLVANYPGFLAGSREITPLFTPDGNTALEEGRWTQNHLLLVQLSDVQTKLSVLTPNDTGWEEKPLDGIPDLTASSIISTDHRNGDNFFINSSGFTTPATLLYGTVGGPLEPVKQAPSFFDADGMLVSQFFAVSEDGTEIPYFVVRRDDAAGPYPTILYGYGGFENSMVPGYSGVVGSAWLERGGAYVVANIRGGGEYGPSWHTQAIREGRHKAFEDFAAVARDLVTRGITTVKQLGIQGGSNGGLLMGVMLTRYPELFGAVVCQVPLLDMKRYHLLLAGASWMAEYGDPDDPEDWKFISEYSPYQNSTKEADYPPILITTSTRDDRVHPGHARKMTALLEEQGHEVWYYENIEGGHGGAADNAQAAFKAAVTFGFLWKQLTR
ncbi:prolyl oligopeptidase [Rhodococcus sp. WMMA185]|uniref:prolyl oligopeptidase family serine peptidase n=1 Tax=Rhodococcus sp. WMMA185 TaxID=679318 RepID=UPI000878A39A|nr:prolyl oligopeptidase family serine peptidase [Rhodococcus sp. WMMA185]AOW93262.1 prolyl oligopeptidase [Rhodococcus sp. WMMA185]